MELWPAPDSPGTCMWWYRSSGTSPMEPSPSITTFPASLDACEEREDEEWRPVPIKFMGLRTRAEHRRQSDCSRGTLLLGETVERLCEHPPSLSHTGLEGLERP